MSRVLSPALLTNRDNWNERADIHVRDTSGFYGIDRLLDGENMLTPMEKIGLGDLSGKRVAHFQCHIGTDTLSLIRQGASEVVGLDFSQRAITHARDLAARSGLNVSFVEGSVYEAPALMGGGFDMVFTSWGTICWLDNLDAWAASIAGVLKPGGELYFCDSHPFALIFENEPGTAVLRPFFDYETPYDRPLQFSNETSYNESDDKLKSVDTFEWTHSASRILNALSGAGLVITRIDEHESLPWRMFDMMVRGEDRLYRMPAGHVRMPLAWTVHARKPA